MSFCIRKRYFANLTILIGVGLLFIQDCPAEDNNMINYPDTKRVEVVDRLHGRDVPDPFRWLETDVRESEEVAAWVEAQNKVTFQYLEQIESREPIRERLTELWNYEKFGTPFKAGGRYYFRKNNGLQNQYVLYVQDSLDEKPEVLIDPNEWSKDGTVALAGTAFSDDGRYVAYGVQEAGSDWRTYRIMNIADRSLLDEELKWIKFTGISWKPDGSGFYYSRYPQPDEEAAFQDLNLNQKVFFHKVGTPQSDDVLIYERPDEPTWGFYSDVTEDGRYLILTIFEGTDHGYRVYYKDLNSGDEAAPDFGFRRLIDSFDLEYSFVAARESTFYFITTKDAPRKRLISVDVSKPEVDWTEIVPEAASVLESVDLVAGQFICEYLENVRSKVLLYQVDGTPSDEIKLDGLGTAAGFGGRQSDDETFYSFSSMITPPSIYRYDFDTGESELLNRSDIDIEPTDYVSRQVFCESEDGTRVPMFVVHRRGIELDGSHPTLLYGYGGFEISLMPRFSITRLMWLELGGVYAMANLRGGGEFGEPWHRAGTKGQKQNVFDDFFACAEWLIDEGYTTPERLAIQGRSNGGLLVGAAITQRPELFGAALPAVGVLDMLRFHRFTAGRYWVDDYGSPDDPEDFKALLAYSPYHNLKEGTRYPATLITTADTDDRVVPGHSFKFAARLQATHAGDAPVLIRIETKAGHGAGKPTSKIIEETADELAFLVDQFKMRLPSFED
ncbi:prolyl oligopeptidase family serine peptidase [Stratiformator vulcanicus]|uniref:prolyl oligopeptidase n=1 Tax=Stratiformator vulcanicus TaxID=2527980 RepID=A0A517R4E9_9PLAN|nr:prolyl oligopeptidase family serine peptidase [Stratiformator vulcanicus]QDT38765.1 Prolyl endopeptidase precursor [Stratiformator vulcanicus]